MFVAIELGNWQAAIVIIILYFLYYSTDGKKNAYVLEKVT